MNAVVESIVNELEANADVKIKVSSQHFFKEPINCHGLKSADVTKISKAYFKTMNHKPKAEIFEMCDELWRTGMLEESFIACNWSYNVHKCYATEDFGLFEKWINEYVTNWASCDTLCNHTVGTFIEMYPEFIIRLKTFAVSDNRWMRRAAAVSLIIPAKNGKFLSDILEIADILLLDKDDMVQKGYGWLLKVTAGKHLNEVYDYVMNNKDVMPRTALRYAIEKMPVEMKKRAMGK